MPGGKKEYDSLDSLTPVSLSRTLGAREVVERRTIIALKIESLAVVEGNMGKLTNVDIFSRSLVTKSFDEVF